MAFCMSLLELNLHCAQADWPRYEQALEAAGSLAITLLDAQANSDHEQAILEPGCGQTPLWGQLHFSALFAAQTDPLALLATLAAVDPDLDWSALRLARVEEQDWQRVWLDQFQPMCFGKRLWIVPWNHALPAAAQTDEAAVVRLDPGLAFGSGTHPTTALCLRWLDELAANGQLAGKTVLDMGCGSGILALAALKLGAASATGIDHDGQALTATQDNAQRNGLCITTFAAENAPTACYDIVLANILAQTLDALAPQLAACTVSGGHIALSGILHGQESELITRYGPWFEHIQTRQEEDWMQITGIRRSY